MSDSDLSQNLLDWSSTFMRWSLHDLNRFTHRAGLSMVQMIVLMHLYYKGPSEMTGLCEMMHVSPAGASQMIERMAQQDLVQRAETPGDRRVRLVSLTEKGRQIVDESIAARRAWIEQFLATLPGEEREKIAAALEAINQLTA
jgi:DNA-binding MarR family transcriptional regulator